MTMFNPRTVFVTGANRGMGLEFVKQILSLSQPPSHVFAACRKPADAAELQKLSETHSSLKIVKLDVNNDADIEEAARYTESVLCGEGLNLLLNNAGITFGGPGLENVTRQNLIAHFDSNVAGPILMAESFSPLLKKAASMQTTPLSCNRAAIINISSIFGSIASVTTDMIHYPYYCTKAALNMATKGMAMELKSAGVLSVAIHPGWVETDMGGPKAPVKVNVSVAECLKTMAKLTEESTGLLYSFDGNVLPW